MFFLAQIHPFIFLGKRIKDRKLGFGYNLSARSKLVGWGKVLSQARHGEYAEFGHTGNDETLQDHLGGVET
jgi:hypothetical protein